ncbi:energy transducer TonB [Altererythrobacter sp. ZODW24]|uniref:energy transducer TonB n=1 Tax=Altererythrobacter sp. ZODW24 TaxID=2185142 RepID=UPI000DF79E71|nr:energy transducer TonB [Altererythrobacter sp. ZODW24]
MAFLTQEKAPPDPRSIILVGGIHALIGTALIAGFATPIYEAIVPERFKATKFKLPPPPPEPQPPVENSAAQPKIAPPVPAPPQPFEFTNTNDFEVKDIPIANFDGMILDPMPGVEDGPAVKPIPQPKPKPKPLFTAFGPEPKNNPGTWATTKDYPRADLREGNEGVTRFILVVGVNGKASACNVTGSSGYSSLDAATCKLVSRRAKFNPGQDTSGAKTGGSYSGSIRWVIPD